MKRFALAIIALGVSGCVPAAEPPKGVAPQHRQASIGDVTICATALQIMETQTFSRISSHFTGTPIADKRGFMYTGTDTAGVPVTEQPRTLFWLYGDKLTPAMTLQPDKASLRTRSGQVIPCITNETIHMSCPSWVFPNWRAEHGRITGFVVFQVVPDPCGELILPYSDQGKVGNLVFRFGEGK